MTENTAPPSGDMGGGGMYRPITGVAAGGIMVMGDLGVNMSKDSVAKPLTLAPDIWYGVSDKLAVGLVHSTWGITGFTGQGPSLCLSGETDGCSKLYRGGLLAAKYELSPGLAADAGLVFDTGGDDTLFALKLGVTGMMPVGPLMLMYAPNIFIGVNKRDFNKELISIPVFAAMPVNEQVMVGVQTGIQAPLKDFGDLYRIPVAVAGTYTLNPNMDVGAAFTFLNLAGKDSSADFRALNIFVKWTK